MRAFASLAGGIGLCKPAPMRTTWPDRPELVALGLALLIGLLRWPLLTGLPLTGDEASNLERLFWQDWSVGREAASSPPLFRWLIHATATPPESILAIRGVAATFGVMLVWLTFRVLRHATSSKLALAGAALVGVQALQIRLGVEQKAYTLWLCVLLAALVWLNRARAGRPQARLWWSFWLVVAAMTHHLTWPVIAGPVVYLLWRVPTTRRWLPWTCMPALALAAPWLWRALMTPELAAEGPGLLDDLRWPLRAAHALFVNAEGLGAALLLIAGVGVVLPTGDAAVAQTEGDVAAARAERATKALRIDRPLLTASLLGATACVMLLGLGATPRARFFAPILPLAVLVAGATLPADVRTWSRRSKALVLAAALTICWSGVTTWLSLHKQAQAQWPAEIVRLDSALPGPTPKLTVLHPSWLLHATAWERTGQRLHNWQDAPPPLDLALRDGERLWGGFHHRLEPTGLKALVERFGSIGVVMLPVDDVAAASAEAQDWLARRCRRQNGDSADPAPAVWRCGREAGHGTAFKEP